MNTRRDDLVLEIENLVKANRYAEALEKLQAIEGCRTEAISLSSRLNRINEQKRQRMITHDQAEVEYSKLTGDILDLLHKPPGKPDSPVTPVPLPGYKRRSLENRRAALIEEHEAISAQLNRALNAGDRVRLQRALDDLDRQIQEIDEALGQNSSSKVTVPPNPFVPWRGRLTDDALFCGRERELRELTQLVARRQSVSLLGERRTGKSSLLHQLIARAGGLSPAPECLYLDMQLVANEADFYGLVLEELGGSGKTWRAFRSAVRGQYILLALDEFEKARKEDLFSFQLRQGLRALAQQGLTLVIATRQPLDRLFADSQGKTSPLYNLCQRYPLGPLGEAEARGLIAAYLAPTGVRFSPDEIAGALRLSGCHPGRLQQAGWHLYEARRRPGYDWQAAYRADPQE